MYTPKTLVIEPRQEKRINNALKKKTGCVIKVRKPHSENDYSEMAQTRDFSGTSASKGVLHLTPEHLEKYNRAEPGTSVPLKFENHHLQENLRHKGGFIPILAAFLAPIIGGVASGLIERKIAGGNVKMHLDDFHQTTTPQSSSSSSPSSSLQHPSLVWYKSLAPPPSSPTTASNSAMDESTSSSSSSSPRNSRRSIAFSIRPDSSGTGLYLSPWKSGSHHHRHFIGGHGLYYSPYQRYVKGMGLLKLDHKKKLPSEYSNFSKQQKKAIANLIM